MCETLAIVLELFQFFVLPCIMVRYDLYAMRGGGFLRRVTCF
jgi:hypothetical protein